VLRDRTPSTKQLAQLVAHVSPRFEADIVTILECLPAVDREALSGLVSRLLIARATEHGLDLFATTDGASA
jgi:hypothetical protein